MPSASILSLAEFLLLQTFESNVEVIPRNAAPGDRVAVAFSGGIDSAAALKLLPDPIPIHTQIAKVTGLHAPENALLAAEEVGALIVTTNYDDFAATQGKKKGFYGAAGFTIPAVLLSEHLGLRTIAEGQVIETAYLYTSHGHGTAFNHKDYSKVTNAFAKAGLQFCLPCAGLTEVATTRIVGDTYRYVMSCMRGKGGQPCLNCMKCYRKEALRGAPIPTCPEVEKVFSKPVIKMLPALLWAKAHKGLRHPVLDAIEDKDISWIDKWFPRSIEFIPPELHDDFLARLRAFGIAPIENEEPLLNWSSAVSSEELVEGH